MGRVVAVKGADAQPLLAIVRTNDYGQRRSDRILAARAIMARGESGSPSEQLSIAFRASSRSGIRTGRSRSCDTPGCFRGDWGGQVGLVAAEVAAPDYAVYAVFGRHGGLREIGAVRTRRVRRIPVEAPLIHSACEIELAPVPYSERRVPTGARDPPRVRQLLASPRRRVFPLRLARQTPSVRYAERVGLVPGHAVDRQVLLAAARRVRPRGRGRLARIARQVGVGRVEVRVLIRVPPGLVREPPVVAMGAAVDEPLATIQVRVLARPRRGRVPRSAVPRRHELAEAPHCHQVLIQTKPAHARLILLTSRTPTRIRVRPVVRPSLDLRARAAALAPASASPRRRARIRVATLARVARARRSGSVDRPADEAARLAARLAAHLARPASPPPWHARPGRDLTTSSTEKERGSNGIGADPSVAGLGRRAVGR